MSIQPIASATSSTTWGTQSATHYRRHNLQHVGLAAAAKALGMTVGDLREALLSGQSLVALAEAKGVATDQLSVAIPAALMQADPTLSAARATALTQRLLQQAPRRPAATGAAPAPAAPASAAGARPRPAGADTVEQEHSGGAAMRAAFRASAEALTMSRDELASALEQGRTLSDLAFERGLDAGALTATVAAAVSGADATLSADRARAVAEQLVQGGPPAPAGPSSGDDADGDTDGD